MNVTGYTHLAAIIGDPVRHSLSPVMHNAAFAAAGLDWLFVALPVERVPVCERWTRSACSESKA